MTNLRWLAAIAAVSSALIVGAPSDAAAQSRGNGAARGGDQTQFRGVTLSVEVQSRIRGFYADRDPRGVQALPPGIRRRLERGKPLPPGIAKQVAPGELVSRVGLPSGYQLVEVGLDVLLVEVATGLIHDVLMDVIR